MRGRQVGKHAKKKKNLIIDPYEIRKVDATLESRPMLFMYNAAAYFRELANNARKGWENTDPVDQTIWRQERMYAGSAFLHYSLYCEALVNNLWVDFKRRDVRDLPDGLTKNLQENVPDDRLPFRDRLYLTPYLCLDNPNYDSKEYFSKGSSNFQRVAELFQIRDSYVHARPTGRKMTMTLRANRVHYLDDSNPENLWPVTQIPRDISILSVHDIEKVRRITDWLLAA